MTTIAQELRINEDYAILVPKISDSWYEHIKEQIKTNGQHVPIVINRKGEILDGLTRNRICKELGIEPRTILCPEKYEDPLLAKQFVISINRDRRHLNDFQLGELYYKLYQYETEIEARRRQKELAGTRTTSVSCDTKVEEEEKPHKEVLQDIEESLTKGNHTPVKSKKVYDSEEVEYIKLNPKEKGRTREIMAKSSGLSSATYSRIKKIIDDGPEEVKQRLRTGKARISKEYNNIQKQEKRQQLLDSAKELDTKLPEGFKLIHGDMKEECKQIPDNSIDAIFSDPPYSLESLPLWEEFANVAVRVMKPGSSLVAMCGGYCLPQIMDIFRKAGLNYNWFCYMRHAGATQAMHGNHAIVCGKVILWFFKGDKLIDTGKYISDFVESELPDKSLHEWAQSTKEADHFLSRLVVKNQIVLDPFLGSGTTGVAALKLGCQFIGIENDEIPESFEKAEARIRLAASQSGKEASA